MNEEKILCGYLVSDAIGNYLSRDYVWVNRKKPEDAYVHSVDALLAIAIMATFYEWEFPPISVIPAQFHTETNSVNVLGEEVLLKHEVKKLQKSLQDFFTTTHLL